jgi:RNA polymerase sigma factor (sigma-70 family)
MMISEEELIKKCLKGKPKYQKMLFDKYAPKMFGVVSRYFSSYAEAQDALQDGFVKVFMKLGDYSGLGSFEGWIRRIMVTTSLNLIRQNSKHQYHSDIDEIQDYVEDESQNYDRLTTADMLDVIQKMPDGYRTIFNLYEIEGYHHNEIASELGISVNTSKSQLLKARQYLRKRISKYYPELKKYPHFYGHYGTAWQNQTKEFVDFPGAIVMTTNCIQKPKDSYRENIFTTGLVGWPGVAHIADKDFGPAIEKALEMPGFPEDTDKGFVMCGFARNAVMGVADKVIEAVKAGAIRHFFLVGGCDGAKPGRSYYTTLVEQIPKDCIVLTLGCGKYRFFDKDLGDIGGIPRLLDIGQCNDAYSAIQIAVALADAFNCDVNELPLSLILSWYEQKEVAILLTLFHLGIKNIRLGPSLPAFITPNVLDVLVKNFNVMPISTPEEDLKAILG